MDRTRSRLRARDAVRVMTTRRLVPLKNRHLTMDHEGTRALRRRAFDKSNSGDSKSDPARSTKFLEQHCLHENPSRHGTETEEMQQLFKSIATYSASRRYREHPTRHFNEQRDLPDQNPGNPPGNRPRRLSGRENDQHTSKRDSSTQRLVCRKSCRLLRWNSPQ